MKKTLRRMITTPAKASALFAFLFMISAVGLIPESARAQDRSCPGYGCPAGSATFKFQWSETAKGFNLEVKGYPGLKTNSADLLVNGSGNVVYFHFTTDGSYIPSEWDPYNLPIKIISVTWKSTTEITEATYYSPGGLVNTAGLWVKSGRSCITVSGDSFTGKGSTSGQGISYIAICVVTPTCPFSTFTETILRIEAPGEIKLTIDDANGIKGVSFVDDSDAPHLINFTVSSLDGKLIRKTSGDDVHWVAAAGPLPTTAELKLTQKDVSVLDAEYFAEITNGCATITHIDPSLIFETEPSSSIVVEGNYPNPFNPSTVISFHVSNPTVLTAEVYDMMGRRIKILLSGSVEAGPHEITWDGTNNEGHSVPGGMYLYRFISEHHRESGTMILIK